MKFCSKCGNQLQENEVFCSKCGQQVGAVIQSEQVNYQAPYQQVQTQPPIQPNNNYQGNMSSSNNKTAIIIIAIIAVLIVGLIIYFVFFNKPTSPKSFEDYIKDEEKRNEELTKHIETNIIVLKDNNFLVEIKNNNNEPVYMSDIVIELYDNNNEIVKSYEAYCLYDIPANSKGYAHSYTIDDVPKYSSAKAKYQAKSTPYKNYDSQVSASFVSKGKYDFVIRVKNNSSVELALNTVEMIFYDNNNNIIGYSSAIGTTTMKAGESITKDVSVPQGAKYKDLSYARYEIFAHASDEKNIN